jgi:hypothetical protein
MHRSYMLTMLQPIPVTSKSLFIQKCLLFLALNFFPSSQTKNNPLLIKKHFSKQKRFILLKSCGVDGNCHKVEGNFQKIISFSKNDEQIHGTIHDHCEMRASIVCSIGASRNYVIFRLLRFRKEKSASGEKLKSAQNLVFWLFLEGVGEFLDVRVNGIGGRVGF